MRIYFISSNVILEAQGQHVEPLFSQLVILTFELQVWVIFMTHHFIEVNFYTNLFKNPWMQTEVTAQTRKIYLTECVILTFDL